MNLKQSHECLVARIRAESQNAQHCRQVIKRLEELWDRQFRQLVRDGDPTPTKASRKSRLSCLSPKHLGAIRERVQLREEALKARVQYETHLMLLSLRRSRRKSPASLGPSLKKDSK